jgi:hypothetical protein
VVFHVWASLSSGSGFPRKLLLEAEACMTSKADTIPIGASCQFLKANKPSEVVVSAA